MKLSVGLLMYCMTDSGPKVFLVYPGGPLGGKKWGIPKGGLKKNEEELIGAIREFEEETGIEVDLNRLMFSGKVKLRKKTLKYWGYMGTGSEEFVQSNMFEMEYPKGSGKMKRFPEIEKGRWFSLKKASSKMDEKQVPMLDRLRSFLQGGK